MALVVLSTVEVACENERESVGPREPDRAAPAANVGSGRAPEVRSFVQAFMRRRLVADPVARFLDADGRRAFARGGHLAPLFPRPRPQRFTMPFVHDLGDGTYEVGVTLVFERGSYGQTLFVHLDKGRWVVSGGRPGLVGP